MNRRMVIELTITGCHDPEMTAEEEAENIADSLLDAWGFPEGVNVEVKVLSREHINEPAPGSGE